MTDGAVRIAAGYRGTARYSLQVIYMMFDVPPPYEGVRGLDAYQRTWPPFFQWQAQGAAFEIESLEITVSDEVAFAYGLLRCGTRADLANNPDNRLRLTLGLRKQDGRWVVTHEHHSFPI